MIPRALFPEKEVTLTAHQLDVCKAGIKAGAAEDLQNYAADWIALDFKTEYERQIVKWRSAMRNVVSAFAHALQEHLDTLKAADAEKQFKWELAMLALSIATAGCMRWIGATIQYKFAPKALSRIDTKRDPADKETYSRTWSAVLGGTTEDLGVISYEQAAKQFAPPVLDFDLKPADIETFRTHLENTLDAAVNIFTGQLAELARSLRESKDFGEKWLRQAKGDKDAAKALVRRKLAELRVDWSRKWPYYGNDPNLRSDRELRLEIERQLWATWLRNMNLRRFADRPTNAHGQPRGGVAISSVVIKRFKTLNIVVAHRPMAKISQDVHSAVTGTPKPAIHIWGDADEKRELVALGEWAWTYDRSHIEKADIPWQPRKMGNLLDMHSR
jgi:hypothetical protein